MQQNKERFELPSGNPPRLTDAKVAAALKSGKDKKGSFLENHFETRKKTLYLANNRQMTFGRHVRMNVNQPSSGVRRPLPTLWTMVHRIDDDQWRQLKAFSEVYGKRSAQFRLLELLRTMAVYDPKTEKAAFADYDLYSLRKNAKYWLIRTGRRLGFYAIEVEDQHGDVEVLLGWGHYEDAFQFVTDAKTLAAAQEDFWVMGGLLEQEKKIVRELFQGEELTTELKRINLEGATNLQNLGLVLAMSQHVTNYMEVVKNKLNGPGILDQDTIASYFQSDAHLGDTVAMPITSQVMKLTMDEFFYFITGKYESAIDKACEIVRILKANSKVTGIEPDKLSKELMNLAAFYIELNRLDDALNVIAQFELESPTSESNRPIYLLHYLYVLFGVAQDFSIPELAQKALGVWREHSQFIASLPHDRLRSSTMLYASWYCLAEGEIEQARSLYAMIKTPPMAMSRLLYQSMMALMHLVLLFEDGDEIGLESIGRQYRRKLRSQNVAPESPTMAVIAFLRSKTNLYELSVRQKALKRLADDLRRCQSQIEYRRSLWFLPLLNWIERQIGPQ